MASLLNELLRTLTIGLAVILAIRLLFMLWRVEYAESMLSRGGEQRERLMGLQRRIGRCMKPLLLGSPVDVILVPLAVYLFIPQIDAVVVFIMMAEVALLAGADFLDRRWLIHYVTTHEESRSA